MTIIKSLFISYVSLISLAIVCISKPDNLSDFSIDLFHRDSPQSPHHDPLLSPTQAAVNAIRRSIDRIQRLSSGHSTGSTETDIVRSTHSGDYFMRYWIGHPQVRSLGVMDTGSDMIWTQCHPCKNCFKQSQPVYTPSSSITYEAIHCNTVDCIRSTHRAPCNKRTGNICQYSLDYTDNTSSSGVLSKDTFTLASRGGGSSTQISGVVFGCGYNNSGVFYGYESGVVGLGRGNHSLVAQLGNLAKGKFSYCMVPRTDKWRTASKLRFGDGADVVGRDVSTTPLLRKGSSMYYFVTLSGMSIDGKTATYSEEGNTLMDSGTALVFLPTNIYGQLRSWLITEVKFPTIEDPKKLLDLCFDTGGRDDVTPTVTFYFGGGAVMSLDREKIFFRTSRDSLCLAAMPEDGGGPGIIGYFAQSDFLVGYDTEKEVLSFKPTNCAA